MNLATLPDFNEEILQEDNDKKGQLRENHLQEEGKGDTEEELLDIGKDQEISKAIFLEPPVPKKQRGNEMFRSIFALASKMGQIKKVKAFYYIKYP
jgi:hypothetical protein